MIYNNLPPLMAVTQETPCKVCSGHATLHGVCDLNKSCEERRGSFLPLAGVPIYYHRCDACGLIFTRAFDRWSKADYLQHIYNEDYVKVDPDYVDIRSRDNAALIISFIKPGLHPKVLDYGGGNGRLAKLLNDAGIDAQSWDPMNEEPLSAHLGSFDLVTAFEVLEHTPDPLASLCQALSLINESGAMLFSTLLSNAASRRGVNHWYISPRNGHITIFTRAALTKLLGNFGFQLHSVNEGLHIAVRA
ncbi:class I SAM-dependent methyltransferase [Ewingella americana]|uniref:Uncharacterized protein n=2 Tax=Ewingella americana TaxID=41202 RepID=A0A085G0F1_EWIA3|nr:class I SAM-dependent methyltransferase [Ewingella americana]KAA8726673.1 class I SAM-dependent methyltransferase [Ewingella americana]KFC77196.1 hypothetical protein GEAM_4322 [Ewingella americana ATCC 33852]STS10431.1 3-demethylubiquinone-9 3-methyltransferase [Ewingella americana]